MSFDDNSNVSDYEKQRLLNIERNKKFLESLNINTIPKQLNRSIQPKRKNSSNENRSGSKKSKPSSTPLRVSLRRRNEHGEIEPIKDLPILNEVSQKNRKEDTIDRSGPICINDIFTYGSDVEQGTRFIGSIMEAHPITKNLSNLIQNDSPWDIKISRKVVPSRLFSMDVHPSLSKILVCVGDKDGVLGFWDASTEEELANTDEKKETSSTFVVKPHTKAISNVIFPKNVPNKVYTSSFDGQLRCLDFTTGTGSNENMCFELVYSSQSMLSSFDFNSKCDGCWISNNLGEIISLDLRTNENITYHVHDKKVTSISVHPTIEHWILTSSLDGSVKIFDTRKMKFDEDINAIKPAQMVTYSSLVHNAYFSPITGSKLIVNSNENIIEIWSKFPNNSDFSQKPESFVRINHNNQTGKWISSFKPMWNDNEDKFVIGNLNRGVEIFNDKGECEEFLKHQLLTTIPSLNVWNQQKNLIISGTASGVYVWKKIN